MYKFGMSDFFSDLHSGIRFPDARINGGGPLPTTLSGPTGINGDPDGRYNFNSELLSGIDSYADPKKGRISSDRNYQQIPHRKFAIVPRLYLPAGDFQHQRMIELSHAVDQGDLAFIVHCPRFEWLLLSNQPDFRTPNKYINLDSLCNVATINYLLAGIQMCPENAPSHWTTLCKSWDYPQTKEKKPYTDSTGIHQKEETDDELNFRQKLALHRIFKHLLLPHGICAGSEKQGGLHETGLAPIQAAVNHVTTLTVDGQNRDLVNIWQHEELWAGDKLILVLEKTPYSKSTSTYVLNHYYKEIKQESFANEKQVGPAGIYQIRPTTMRAYYEKMCREWGNAEKMPERTPAELIAKRNQFNEVKNIIPGYWQIGQVFHQRQKYSSSTMTPRNDTEFTRGGLLQLTFAPVFMDYTSSMDTLEDSFLSDHMLCYSNIEDIPVAAVAAPPVSPKLEHYKTIHTDRIAKLYKIYDNHNRQNPPLDFTAPDDEQMQQTREWMKINYTNLDDGPKQVLFDATCALTNIFAMDPTSNFYSIDFICSDIDRLYTYYLVTELVNPKWDENTGWPVGNPDKPKTDEFSSLTMITALVQALKIANSRMHDEGNKLLKFPITITNSKTQDAHFNKTFVMDVMKTIKDLYMWENAHKIWDRSAHPLFVMISMFTRAYLAAEHFAAVKDSDFRIHAARIVFEFPGIRRHPVKDSTEITTEKKSVEILKRSIQIIKTVIGRSEKDSDGNLQPQGLIKYFMGYVFKSITNYIGNDEAIKAVHHVDSTFEGLRVTTTAEFDADQTKLLKKEVYDALLKVVDDHYGFKKTLPDINMSAFLAPENANYAFDTTKRDLIPFMTASNNDFNILEALPAHHDTGNQASLLNTADEMVLDAASEPATLDVAAPEPATLDVTAPEPATLDAAASEPAHPAVSEKSKDSRKQKKRLFDVM